MLAAAVYAGGYGFELASRTLDEVQFWLRIEYLGAPFLGPLWFILALQFSGHGERLSRRVYALLLAIPVLTAVAQFTNSHHHLVLAAVDLERTEPITLAGLVDGPLNWLAIAYSYVCVLAGTAPCVRMYRRSMKTTRRQVLLVVLGGWAPLLLHGVYLLGLPREPIDLTPFGLAVSGVLFSLGILRFDLLRLTPIALAQVFESLRDGVIVLDEDKHIAKFNRQAAVLFPELVGANRDHRALSDILREHADLLDLLAGGGDCQAEYETVRNGRPVTYRLSVSRLRDNGELIGWLLTFTDITQDKQMVARLSELALTDELTGLPNRRYFRETCARAIDQARAARQPISVIMLDIDHFKAVNDRHGHSVGDTVLRRVADLLRNHLPERQMIARLGGEEFLVLLPDTRPQEAQVVAERLRAMIAEQLLVVGETAIRVTASFGVYGRDVISSEEDYEEFLRMADRAMYRAKEAGRNRVLQIDDASL